MSVFKELPALFSGFSVSYHVVGHLHLHSGDISTALRVTVPLALRSRAVTLGGWGDTAGTQLGVQSVTAESESLKCGRDSVSLQTRWFWEV